MKGTILFNSPFFLLLYKDPFFNDFTAHLDVSSRGLTPRSWNYILNCKWIVSPKSVSLVLARSSWKFSGKAFIIENILNFLSSTFLLQLTILSKRWATTCGKKNLRKFTLNKYSVKECVCKNLLPISKTSLKCTSQCNWAWIHRVEQLYFCSGTVSWLTNDQPIFWSKKMLQLKLRKKKWDQHINYKL